ncbi:Spo0B domain-containing protein [Paenibacillus beijingensis]|uniref:SpoOB alpha-helical domain-containing protein n=1 Tax=Paenibacillus beijingensis TaxID=1126833 RepID=A0A0D5NLC0_9BACL|nr:Spo0B domain-containing protein [Paenibacillus beijingensis]AJY76071.1 hypothetical protein VN24_17785 [Paenibacillus beijingensis]
MNRFGAAKLSAAVSVLLPAASVIIWPSLLWVHAVFVFWLAGASAVWIAADRKEGAGRLERAVQAVQKSAIHTLNHHRHDWMNELQVLYGYIRMGKPDKAVASVEKIRDKMAIESRISKLGVPSLVTFIQSFRTFSHSLQLDVDIDTGLQFEDLPLDRQAIADAIVDVVNAYRFQVKPGPGEPATLRLRIYCSDNSLQVELHYDGDIKDEDQLLQILKQRLLGTPLQAARLTQFHHVLLEAKLSA